MVLIWNVGFISFPSPSPSFLLLPLPFLLHPPTSSSLPPSSPVTHSSINIGITITLDDYWETWAILCTHGLFSDRISGDHSWVFTDTVQHLHIITTARSWTFSLHTMQTSGGRYKYMFIYQTIKPVVIPLQNNNSVVFSISFLFFFCCHCYISILFYSIL